MTVIHQSIKSELSMRFYLSAITTFIVLCIITFIIWQRSLHSEMKVETTQPAKLSVVKSTNDNTLGEPKLTNATDTVVPDLSKYVGDIRELQTKERKRGYFTEEDRISYEAYSDSILEDLCKNGDILASDTLAERSINKGNIKNALTYLWKSAALGSTFAFLTIANISDPVFYNNLSAEDERNARRDATIESLAIKKVADLRGDQRLRSLVTGPLSAYELRYGPVNLTEDELQKINQRSQQLYDELQAKRLDMGLGPFDNSSPRLE